MVYLGLPDVGFIPKFWEVLKVVGFLMDFVFSKKLIETDLDIFLLIFLTYCKAIGVFVNFACSLFSHS